MPCDAVAPHYKVLLRCVWRSVFNFKLAQPLAPTTFTPMMSALSTKKALSTFTPFRNQMNPCFQECHRALKLPEVLSLILSYAIGSDISPPWSHTDFAFNPRVSNFPSLLVCKQWRGIAQNLLRGLSESQWDNGPSTDPSALVFGSRQLRCRFWSAQDAAKSKSRWLKLIASLEDLQKPPNEMVLADILAGWNIIVPLLQAPRLARSITLLELSFIRYTDVDLSLLLLPNKALGTTGLPHLRHLVLRRVGVANLLESPDSQPPLILTSLCLYSVQIQKDSLATLMTLLHGPSLDRLCIADACTSLSPPASADALNAVTLVTLADLVRWSQYFPFLRSIEVQIAHNPDFIGLLVRLQQLFPRADLLGIDYRGPSRPLATGFIHVDGLLTRLEVQKKNWHSSFPAAHLSVFLCSDQARHLDTLHAPGIEFPVKMLSARTSSTYDAPDGAWRCKNLRHLSIQLIGRMSMDYSVDLRFVLAYFVANCPNLVHLELEREDIHFHPEGGLCLTSRLPHLQRLIFRVLYYVGHTVSKGGSYEDTWAPEAKARWILPHPTKRDIELAQSSLRLCRSVAELSLDPNLIQNDILLSGEGCCWIQMDLLHIELAQSKYNGIDMARQDVKVFRRLRPDIAFSVTES